MLFTADAGKIKLPVEIFNEIAISKGDLKDWLTAPDHAKKLKLTGQVDGVAPVDHHVVRLKERNQLLQHGGLYVF
jgi:hypothetical protein